MRKYIASWMVCAVLLAPAAARGQSSQPSYILDWLRQPEGGQSFFDSLHSRLSRWLDVVVRYTSPDIPGQSRRLWRVSADGADSCLVSAETGVSMPRWGKANYIAYLVEADTNDDGKIDFRDEFEVHAVPASGGVAKTLGQGVSAAWSPDGMYVAILHNQRIEVVDLAGKQALGATRPAGQIVMANSLNPRLASDFIAMDSRTGTTAPLSGDLAKKYLWLGVLSPSGSKVVYSNTTGKELMMLDNSAASGRTLIGGEALYLEPAWSPDEKSVVYVSTQAEGDRCGTAGR
jgi:hypothetical protein